MSMDLSKIDDDLLAVMKNRGLSVQDVESGTPEGLFIEFCEWHGLQRWGCTLIGVLDELRNAEIARKPE